MPRNENAVQKALQVFDLNRRGGNITSLSPARYLPSFLPAFLIFTYAYLSTSCNRVTFNHLLLVVLSCIPVGKALRIIVFLSSVQDRDDYMPSADKTVICSPNAWAKTVGVTHRKGQAKKRSKENRMNKFPRKQTPIVEISCLRKKEICNFLSSLMTSPPQSMQRKKKNAPHLP